MQGIRKNSLRLKTWDYSSPGSYFFTICTNDRKEIFDTSPTRDAVIDEFTRAASEGIMILNAIVVAADHLHGIVTLDKNSRMSLSQYLGKSKVRVSQRLRKQDSSLLGTADGEDAWKGGLGPPIRAGKPAPTNAAVCRGDLGRPGGLVAGSARNRAGKPAPTNTRVWQRSFYDHVIRDERDFIEKARYIENHPFKEDGTICAEWH